jgi:flagellar hook-associated protein 2
MTSSVSASASTTGLLSSPGIGSGLDVNSIVQAMVAAESQPLTDLQTAAQGLNTKLSAVGQVQSYLSSLSDALSALTDPTLWSRTAANSSDTSSVNATASAGAAAGNYNIAVGQLASSQSASSAAFTSSSATVGTGVLTISTGSWSSDNSSFTAGSAAPVTISIDAGDTLAQIRDKINGANAGVTAAIVTDGSGARLSITSSQTGAANAFKIDVSDGGDGNDTDAAGLSALAYDPAAGTQGLTRNQSAADAQATINGIAVTSASNTLSNVLDGLTLTLSKVTSSPVSVTVSADSSAAQSAINGFVTSYNNAMSYLRSATKYDAGTKVAGPLQGDMTIVSLTSQLRSMIGGNSSASGVFQRLSDIGIQPQQDGSLKVDSGKLSTALGNLPELQKMLAAPLADGAANSTSGMAQQLYSYVSGALSFDGVLTGETNGINARLKDNSSQQDAMQQRINAYQARVQAQYQALDTQMGSLNSLSSYVSQQMSLLAKQG